MPLAPTQSGPLAFGEFLEYLHRQGFSIGVDHHLRLHRLLERVGAQCSPQELKQLLCPIFASSKEEQELFYRAFDEFFAFYNDPRSLEASIHQPGVPVEDGTPVSPPRPIFGRTLIALLAIAIALFALVFSHGEFQKLFGWTTPTPIPSIEPSPTIDIQSPSPAIPSPQVTSSVEAPVVTPAPVTQPDGHSIRNQIYRYRRPLRGLVLALPLAGFALWEWRRRQRQRLALERAQGLTPPLSWPVAPPAPELKFYRAESFYRASRWLRRRQVGEFQRLDIARTITATIETRGYPAFRYRPDSRVPEYLILIDRASPQDHQARLFDALAQSLDREGIFTVRYFYDGDPRVCRTGTSVGDLHLTEVQKRYPSHRLLMFGDGEGLLDPITGQLAPWASLLLEWPERAVLTPLRRSLWRHRERALADHFILLPATLSGLAELAERYENPTLTDFQRIESKDLSAAEIEITTPPDEAVVQLKKYLGESAFQWLCALAVYPELQWELTLFLGSLPCMSTGLLQEPTLLRLCSLPWMRAGAFPDPLRLALLRSLDPARETAVRAALVELLKQNPAPAGSFAENDRRLQVIVQQAWIDRKDQTQYQRAVRPLTQSPPEDAQRDYTLLKLLEDQPPSRLALLAPQALRRFVYPKGLSFWGPKTRVGVAAAFLTIIAGWIAIGLLGARPAFTQYSYIDTLVGHADEVNTVAFSPDGKMLASGSKDKTLILWSRQSRQLLNRLRGGNQAVLSVAFSSMENTLATGGGDSTVRIWNTLTKEETVEFREFFGLVSSVCFSADGRRLTAGSNDKSVKLWDLTTKESIATFNGHTDVVHTVAFSPDGGMIASGSSDFTVRLWDVQTRQNLATLQGHRGAVFSVVFSPDGKTLASASGDGAVKLWDLQTKRVMMTLNEGGFPFSSVAYSPDGRFLAAGNWDGFVYFWDAKAGEELTKLNGRAGSVLSISFSPDGKTLASGCSDGLIKLWGDPRDSASTTEGPTPTPSPSPSLFASPTAAPSQPTLATNARSLNFGPVEISDPTSQGASQGKTGTLQVSNAGSAPLVIGQAAISGPNAASFSIVKNGCANRSIPSRLGCSYSIRFAPNQAGQFSATLTLSNNGTPNQTRIALIGTGYERPAFSLEPKTLDFGSQYFNQTSEPRPLTLTNIGSRSFSIGVVNVSGAMTETSGKAPYSNGPTNRPQQRPFILSNNGCANRTLQPKESCTIQITFTPTAPGRGSGSVSIAIGASTARAELSGVGQAPQSAK